MPTYLPGIHKFPFPCLPAMVLGESHASLWTLPKNTEGFVTVVGDLIY